MGETSRGKSVCMIDLNLVIQQSDTDRNRNGLVMSIFSEVDNEHLPYGA